MGGKRRQVSKRLEEVGLAMAVGTDEHHRTGARFDGDLVPRAKITQGESTNEQDLFLGIGCAKRFRRGDTLDGMATELVAER